MKHIYGEYDGQKFATPDSLFSYDQIMDFVLDYGDKALEALERLHQTNPELLEKLMQEGLLEKVAGRMRLTPRAISTMQRKALMEIFANLPRGSREGHPTLAAGAGSDRLESTKPYAFGDPVSELDMNQSLRNAMTRNVSTGRFVGLPIQFNERDLELHLVEGTTSCSLCILIDMSGSMMRHGRFLAAKKVAMALTALVRQRYPQDTIDIVGFYSTATRISEQQLPLLMPKPVSTHEYEIRLSIPLAQAAHTHQHFTNLQLALQMGRRILTSRPAEQKMMFIITDGQPTAHVEADILHLIYPPEQVTALATLREALLCTRARIRVATFALIEDYWGMEWVEFVDQLTRLCRGVAFYCASDDLASCVMESYLSGKKNKAYLT